MSGPPPTTARTEAAGKGWQGRDLAGRVVKWMLTLAPLVVAAGVSIGLSVVLPTPSSWRWALVRIAMIAALSMTTITIVERSARRLLPLSTLLRLSLVFPDQAPSRFKLALKAGSGKRMERALTEARTNGLSADRAQAAEQLVLLSTAIGAHDRRTRGHSERVRLYAELLGEELHLSDDDRHRLQWAALIHDMGKVRVPPEILNKKGKPNAAEWAILQDHPLQGEELVAPVAEWLGEWIHAVGGHHERWDGKGYPRRLAGHDIPRAAAIVAVADSFEVMTAVRSYKSAMSLADARAELTRCSGNHFSPEMVRAFLNISLPKLRRAGGALASLAHVPFLGNALTAGAKAPEAWGYGITSLANAGSTAVASAAVTGILIAAPVAADSHTSAPPVAAAAMYVDQSSTPAPAGRGAPSSPQEQSVLTETIRGESPPTTARAIDSTPADGTALPGAVDPARSPPTLATSSPVTTVAQATPTTTAPTTTTTAPTSTAPPTTAPPATPPPATISTTPNTIADLIAILTPNPDAYGNRGSNLLAKLNQLQSQRATRPDTDSHVIDQASSLSQDVDKWLQEGRLDATIGADAKRLLAPLIGA